MLTSRVHSERNVSEADILATPMPQEHKDLVLVHLRRLWSVVEQPAADPRDSSVEKEHAQKQLAQITAVVRRYRVLQQTDAELPKEIESMAADIIDGCIINFRPQVTDAFARGTARSRSVAINHDAEALRQMDGVTDPRTVVLDSVSSFETVLPWYVARPDKFLPSPDIRAAIPRAHSAPRVRTRSPGSVTRRFAIERKLAEGGRLVSERMNELSETMEWPRGRRPIAVGWPLNVEEEARLYAKGRARCRN